MTRRALPTLLLLAACGGDDVTATTPGDAQGVAGPADVAPPVERPSRSDDPRVVQVRAAIDAGDLDLAGAMIDEAAGLAGPVEGPLLRARLAAYRSGGDLDALAFLEQARGVAVDDPRVAATCIEIDAWTGDLPAAEEGLREAGVALGAADRPPELLRAFAVTILCTPGARPREALGLLEEALEADPQLPFTRRALGQAHMLVAKELASTGDFANAVVSVERSLEFDSDDLDTLRLKAELLQGANEWGLALQVYEELLAEDLPLEGEAANLYKNAGFWAKANFGDDELAERYLRRALELGLPREALGLVERQLLAELALDRVQAAGLALDGGDLEACEAALDDALHLDPGCRMGRYVLGKLYVERAGEGEFEKAVVEWQLVVTNARLDGVELPLPVHLELARHQALGLDDFAGALETLEAYLTLEPEGRWVEQTRALLELLGPPPEDDTDQEAAEGESTGESTGEEAAGEEATSEGAAAGEAAGGGER